MTVQETDICLNISAEPASIASVKNNERLDNFVKKSIKRLKKQSINKKKSATDVSTVAQTNKKTRIKQRSLAAIVARKLNEQSSLQQDTLSTKSSEKSVNSGIRQKKDLSENPTISFTKVPKENLSKAIVAKKRNVTDTNVKKSLSDIYSNQSINLTKEETNLKLLKNVPHKDQTVTSEKDNVSSLHKDTQDTQKDESSTMPSRRLKKDNFKSSDSKLITKRLDSFDKKKKRKHKGGIEKTSGAEIPPRGGFKPTGKTSSLFRNNPEVPHIGQRLVKPISETVFVGTKFSDLGIHQFMVSNLEQNMNITTLTMVQQMAIPQILSGKDVLIRSQTGSGKTLAYAVPIVEKLQRIQPNINRGSGVKALIVVPTRELALQSYECFLKLVRSFTWIVPGYLVGGEKRKAEKARLRKGCNILVGTPGRLLDHIKHTAALKLNHVEYFVLDEADRMLDAGYERDIAGIVEALKNVENSSYNAMEIFRQNTKKVFTEEELECAEKNLENQETEEKNEEEKQEEKEEEEEESDKLSYHSNSDSEQEEHTFPMKSKKILKKNNREKENEETNASKTKENEKSKKGENSRTTKRQTILLSATLTQAVERLAGLAMESPIFVDAAKENLTKVGGNLDEANEDFVVPQSVNQTYIVTPPKLRMVTLSAYIAARCKMSGEHKMLVFMATQDMVDYYTEILSSVLNKVSDEDDEDADPLVDVEFFKLHGNMNQKERTEVFKTFRQTKTSVLLCTDVAARGLDLPKVDCVLQYTGPLSVRDYVHRIGRTARAGSSGSAVIFLTPAEVEFVRELESKRIRIKQEDMEGVLDKLLGPLSKYNSVQHAATALQNEFETLLLDDAKLYKLACKAYVSWVRFYASYPRDMRAIFNRKDLHLGHYAKSFALRDPPQKIGGIGRSLHEKEAPKAKHNNRLTIERPQDGKAPTPKRSNGDARARSLKRVRMLNVSEYDSGLEPLKKVKKS